MSRSAGPWLGVAGPEDRHHGLPGPGGASDDVVPSSGEVGRMVLLAVEARQRHVVPLRADPMNAPRKVSGQSPDAVGRMWIAPVVRAGSFDPGCLWRPHVGFPVRQASCAVEPRITRRHATD